MEFDVFTFSKYLTAELRRVFRRVSQSFLRARSQITYLFPAFRAAIQQGLKRIRLHKLFHNDPLALLCETLRKTLRNSAVIGFQNGVQD